jgi:hypothetical protein
MKLITILESLRQARRQLTVDENLYLDHLADELKRAGSDATRWHILEREGLSRLDCLNFSEDVIGKLTEIRRSALH